MKLVPAEYSLLSSKEGYKTDACILDGDNELCLLETSGKFLLGDSGKYGYDYIEVTFDALSIFNATYKKYCWAL